MPRPDSLRARLVLWTLLPTLGVLIACAVVTYLIAYSVANRAYDYSLQDEARTLAMRVRTTDGTPQLSLPADVREVLEYDPLDREYFQVRSRRHGLLGSNAALPAPSATSGPEGTYYDNVVDGEPVRLFALPVGDDLEVVVAETLNKREALTTEILSALVLAETMIIALGGALLWYGTGRALEPLRRLIDALALRGQHDLRPVDAGPAPAELRYLSQAVNALMERLERSLSTQRRFIADAAHQLRTPLAGLLAQIEAVIAEPDPGAMRAALVGLRQSSKRAARLVNQLLALARAEPGQQTALDFEWLDLNALVRTTCASWVPQALASGRELGFEGSEAPVPVRGNAPLLEEMLGNLIENAIRYAKADGKITVAVAAKPGEPACVEVSDDGAPIPAAERERIFERFYRRPGSPGTGSGLGLAIVREVARMHGASVQLRAADHGNTFAVTFEAASASGPSGAAQGDGTRTAVA